MNNRKMLKRAVNSARTNTESGIEKKENGNSCEEGTEHNHNGYNFTFYPTPFFE